MSRLKPFIYEDSDNIIYYLSKKECDNYRNVLDQIWHREDGPAYISYYEDGRIRYEGYYINDKEHREDGPAWIWYDKDGIIIKEFYWLDNENYIKEEYDREIRKRNTKIGKELYE